MDTADKCSSTVGLLYTPTLYPSPWFPYRLDGGGLGEGTADGIPGHVALVDVSDIRVKDDRGPSDMLARGMKVFRGVVPGSGAGARAVDGRSLFHSSAAVEKIYTRTGDKGSSSLYNGERRPKTDLVFEALGHQDELCAVIGIAREHCQKSDNGLADVLAGIQSRIFDLGASVATPVQTRSPCPYLTPLTLALTLTLSLTARPTFPQLGGQEDVHVIPRALHSGAGAEDRRPRRGPGKHSHTHTDTDTHLH